MPKVGMEPIRRKQVINATLECISESGFDGLTLESVGKKAGVSKGVVSYYLKGKDDLILQSLRAFLEHYNKKVGEAMLAEESALRMLEKMVDIVVSPESSKKKAQNTEDSTIENTDEQLITLAEENYFSLLVNYYSQMAQNVKLREAYIEIYHQYLDGTIEILKYGIEKGEFKFVDLLPTAYQILSQLDGTILYESLGFQPLGKREVIKACKTHLKNLLT